MPESRAKQWIGYRPEIRIIDCTIRDGGLNNDHKFGDEVVRGVYLACCQGGVDYMEIGYRGAPRLYKPGEHGKWRFCAEDELKAVVDSAGEYAGRTKLSVMADVDRTDVKNDFQDRAKSVVSMVRVATYIHQIPSALDLLKEVADRGYETCINLMALSTVPQDELEGALELMAKSPANAIYVVDSNGSLYTEQVKYYVELFAGFAKATGKEIGIHTHNNQQLAFANSIEAIVRGANFIDSSLMGLGRGAGNCLTEQLVGFLHNPRYRLRPIVGCVQHHIEPLRKEFTWGPDIPYMLSGLLNRHPRAAMEFNDGPDRGNFEKFYDLIME